jgi:acylphosphatase
MATPVFRLEVHFSGRVQGVGFRYQARQTAQGFAVTGQVRNLPDGRVQLIAEGAENEVRAFVSEIKTEMNHHIHETSERVLDGPAQFRNFYIG